MDLVKNYVICKELLSVVVFRKFCCVFLRFKLEKKFLYIDGFFFYINLDLILLNLDVNECVIFFCLNGGFCVNIDGLF